MDKEKKKRSLLTRSFCATCALSFLGAIGYLFIFGFELVAALVITASFGGLATTSAVISEGFIGFFITLVELFLEGINALFQAIASLFNF